MHLVLRPGLSWCICAGRAVFLDLERDRYFCLPAELDHMFLRWASGERLGDEDRDRLVASGITQAGESGPARAATFAPASRDLGIIEGSGPSLPDLYAAVIGQFRARRALKRRPLAHIIASLARKDPAAPLRRDESRLRQIALAFAKSALVMRAADQCLPRAIAAQQRCRHDGLDSALLIGVRLHPFAAHSWVQAGNAVVVGDLELVRLYTPILMVR
ncbi:lasso peptide biosynthesis B2 protein [Sphingomonas sp. HMWF008]|nr:lasso peptide biosynthesis B2 protein [Sphingomonas sp. HMWF008]